MMTKESFSSKKKKNQHPYSKLLISSVKIVFFTLAVNLEAIES